MSQFSDAVAAGLAAMATLTAEPVTLRRGETEVTVQATPAGPVLDTMDAGPARGSAHAKDWLIPAAAYDLGAGAVEPARGDEIDRTEAGTVYTYTVTPREGRTHRPADDGRTVYRVHTTLTGTA